MVSVLLSGGNLLFLFYHNGEVFDTYYALNEKEASDYTVIHIAGLTITGARHYFTLPALFYRSRLMEG